MFEVGQRYKLILVDHDGYEGESSIYCEVKEYEAPLLKVKWGDTEKIINTASKSFVGAELRPGSDKPMSVTIQFSDDD